MEFDRMGVGQHELGAKLDGGKILAGRLLGMFANALGDVSAVGTYGAEKYTEGGWQYVEDGIQRYEDAQVRHWLKRHQGEILDPETNLRHAAHEAWNALAKLELMIREDKNKETVCSQH